MVAIVGFCSQLLPNMKVRKHFSSTIVEERKFNVCQHTSKKRYVGSSIFNFIMKSSSKKGSADKHSISMAVGCMLLAFEVKAVTLL